MSRPCVRLVGAPRLLRTCVDAAPLQRQLELDPCSVDLLVDFRGVTVFEDEAAQLVRGLLFWRVHWSRVGCVADGDVARALTSMHLARVLPIGPHLPDVIRRMHLDPRPPPGGRRLLMGPGPAAAGASA